MARSKHFDFADISSKEGTRGNQGKTASQIMQLYRACLMFERPMVLECGTGPGYATTVLVEACEAKNGTMVSVDILDCSDVVASDRWRFIREDDRNVARILAHAPCLNQGIDVMYIDSVHSRQHVEQVLSSWWPYLRPRSFIFFDDIDPNPYRKGQRKDRYSSETARREVYQFTKEFFYANEDEMFLEHHFGSTGLAKMTKLSAQGTPAGPAVAVVDRSAHPIRRLLFKLNRKWARTLRVRRDTGGRQA